MLWCLVRDIKHYALVVMDSIDQAYPMLEAIKAELEFNPRSLRCGTRLADGHLLHYDSVLSRTLNNPLWRQAHFKALHQWPVNLSLWETWEQRLRNQGEDAAQDFYTSHRTEMEESAEVSWSARPLLTLMHIRARDGHATFYAEYQNDPVSGEDALFAYCLHFWVNQLNE
ncbi:hypothetical protein [Sodalis glossinidius]|uniref:hypothetical protein n=1 Tax=Sodalis glossinidius TaxID=63612 RepID=UPI001FB052DC|nr:hypothetical protein [Sodalis glossinidius]